jgi:hypothetical protein
MNEIRRGSSSVGDSLNVAGLNESSRLFGHKGAAFLAGNCGSAAAKNSLTEEGRVTRWLAACQEVDARSLCPQQDTLRPINREKVGSSQLLANRGKG